MSTETEKTAAPAPLSREQLLQQYYGKQLLRSVGAGAGIGLGATALYQLLRELKSPGKKEKKYSDPPAYGSGSPMFAKEGFDITQAIGSLLPKHMLPVDLSPGGIHGGPSADPYAWRKAWSTAANVGGAAAGALGGHKLVNAIVKAKKKREMAEAVEGARRSYYDALAGLDKAAALDEAYERMKESNVLLGTGIGAGLGGLVGLLRSEKGERLNSTLAGVGAGGIAGAGIGAVAPHLAPHVQPYLNKARAFLHELTAPPAGPKGPPTPPPVPPAAGPKGPPKPPPVPPAAGPKGPVTPPPVPPAAPGGTPWTPPLQQMEAAVGLPLPGTGGSPTTVTYTRAVGAPLQDTKRFHEIFSDKPNVSYHDTMSAPPRRPPPSPPKMMAKGAGVLSSMYNTPQALRTAYVLSMLGAGGLGAKYMYDRTRALTEGENMAKARASRARLKGLPPVWVDPDSLAQVKQLAENDE